MLLIIDYGGSSAKAVLIFDDDRPPFVFEVPLGFSAYTDISVADSLLFIIGEVAEAAGERLVEAGQVKVPTYVVGEIASTKLKRFLAADPADPAEVLRKAPWPLISVGMGFSFVLGKAFRGEVKSEDVLRWLPFRIELSKVANFLANEKLFEQVVPATPRDLTIKQAIGREIIKAAKADGEVPAEVVATGAVFSKAPRLTQAALMLLDGLEPRGLLKIKVDQARILRSLALLRSVSPPAFEKVLSQAPRPVLLGTTVSLGGGADLRIDLGAGDPQEIKAATDSLFLLPLGAGETARIAVAGKEAEIFEVEGGEVGVIIDCRKRPLSLPPSAKERHGLLKEWDKAVNAHGQVEKIGNV